MNISREGFILAKKDSSTGLVEEPLGMSEEGGPTALCLFGTVEDAMAMVNLRPEMKPLYMFKVHLVVVGEAFCEEN